LSTPNDLNLSEYRCRPVSGRLSSDYNAHKLALQYVCHWYWNRQSQFSDI